MPKKTIEVSVELGDYFSKYGFGDGDDGAAIELGWTYLDNMVAFFNKEFKRAKLKLVARRANLMSIHNECQIELLVKTPGGGGNRGNENEFSPYDDSPEKLDDMIGKGSSFKFRAIMARADEHLARLMA